MRVLVVEDKPAFLRLICSHLTKHGFVVDGVETIKDALATVRSASYDMVLLDLMLPDGHGGAFMNELRREGRKVPVIVMSAHGGLADRINLLDGGADDYLVKPFDFDELIARIRAIIRRRFSSRPDAERQLMFSNIIFYPEGRFVAVNGRNVTLRRHEAALLETLFSRAGEPVDRGHLMSCVYSEPGEIGSNSLAVHIHHLREKLREAEAKVYITSVRGVGYALQYRDPDTTTNCDVREH
jgi:two-component system OmpR family response regulator